METESMDCESTTRIIPNDNGTYRFSSTKNLAAAAVVTNIVGPTSTAAATSVYELLECPVCTFSMYPPIHQVKVLFFDSFIFACSWSDTTLEADDTTQFHVLVTLIKVALFLSFFLLLLLL